MTARARAGVAGRALAWAAAALAVAAAAAAAIDVPAVLEPRVEGGAVPLCIETVASEPVR